MGRFASLTAFFRDALIVAAGVWIAAVFVNGIPQNNYLAVLLAACVISFLNAFLRPLMIARALPFVIGLAFAGGVFNIRALAGKILWMAAVVVLAVWLINAFIFWLAFFCVGVSITFATALWGSVWASLASLCVCAFFGIKRQNLAGMVLQHLAGARSAGTPDGNPFAGTRESPKKSRGNNDDDVIDI